MVLDLASLSMTDPADIRDTQVQVKLGSTVLGTSPVTTTVSNSPDNSANSNDDAGTAHVDVVVPAGTTAGPQTLTITGPTTGTQVLVPIIVGSVTPPAKVASTITADLKPNKPKVGHKVKLKVTVAGVNGSVATGQIRGQGEGREGRHRDAAQRQGHGQPGQVQEEGKQTVTIDYLGSDTFSPAPRR